jgi:uncharacterized membrane protein YdjX (TVP38/TMEM64 family)
LVKGLRYAEGKLKELGPLGPVLIFVLMFLSAFPLPIYKITLVLSGYIYGMKILFVTLAGSIAGAMFVFSISRSFGSRELMLKWMSASRTLKKLHEAATTQGFRIICLIRIIPFPFSILNIAASGIPMQVMC